MAESVTPIHLRPPSHRRVWPVSGYFYPADGGLYANLQAAIGVKIPAAGYWERIGTLAVAPVTPKSGGIAMIATRERGTARDPPRLPSPLPPTFGASSACSAVLPLADAAAPWPQEQRRAGEGKKDAEQGEQQIEERAERDNKDAAASLTTSMEDETTNRQGGAPRRDNPTQIPQIEHKSTPYRSTGEPSTIPARSCRRRKGPAKGRLFGASPPRRESLAREAGEKERGEELETPRFLVELEASRGTPLPPLLHLRRKVEEDLEEEPMAGSTRSSRRRRPWWPRRPAPPPRQIEPKSTFLVPQSSSSVLFFLPLHLRYRRRSSASSARRHSPRRAASPRRSRKGRGCWGQWLVGGEKRERAAMAATAWEIERELREAMGEREKGAAGGVDEEGKKREGKKK
nr:unnamed protein product [Digitaria exilis]